MIHLEEMCGVKNWIWTNFCFNIWKKEYDTNSLNRFPAKVNLTYKGKDSFRSFSGGFVSVLIYAITLSMIGVLMRVVILKEKSNFSVNQIQKDITNNNEKHYFAKDNISFAIKLLGPNPEKLIDKSYFKFEIMQTSNVRTSSGSGYTSHSTIL